jgi:hypothetical protein
MYLKPRPLEKIEEGVVNAFQTWCRRIMLKIKWTDRITHDKVFQRGEKRVITFGNLKL